MSASSNMDVPSPEIDPNFEPQIRARSNTWPLRPKEFIKEEPSGTPPHSDEKDGEIPQKDLGVNKKTSSRRNAWGNMSYADLITKAIQGSPEQRLTLSQVYEWMVQNIPYFKDKGDSNSSAGWKNSIRHNLSLHSRFMRIQNEGTGKSSWWVINPDAKPGKTPRRRAASMDTKAFEKKRGRAKKKAEALRASLEHGLSPSASSLNEESSFSDNFNLSPQDFRERTCSNASSVGRLSPIQSAQERDMHDSQVPPMSPIPWSQQESMSTTSYKSDGFTETLTESLREMIVGDTMNTLSPMENLVGAGTNGVVTGSGDLGSSYSTPSPLSQQQLSPNSTGGSLSYSEGGNLMPAPPPYPDQQMRTSPQHSRSPQPPMGLQSSMPTTTLPSISSLNQSMCNSSLTSSLGNNGLQSSGLVGCLSLSGGFMQQQQQQPSPQEDLMTEGNRLYRDQTQQSSDLLQDSLLQENLMSRGNFHSLNSSGFLSNSALRHALMRQQQQQQRQQQQQQQQSFEMFQPQMSAQDQRRVALLHQSLVIKQEPQQQMEVQPQTQLLQQLLTAPDNPQASGPLTINTGTFQQPQQQQQQQQHQQHQQHQQQHHQNQQQQPHQHNLPQDIDYSLCDFKANDLDVEQILKHELSFDSNLDFNFEAQQAESSFGAVQT